MTRRAAPSVLQDSAGRFYRFTGARIAAKLSAVFAGPERAVGFLALEGGLNPFIRSDPPRTLCVYQHPPRWNGDGVSYLLDYLEQAERVLHTGYNDRTGTPLTTIDRLPLMTSEQVRSEGLPVSPFYTTTSP